MKRHPRKYRQLRKQEDEHLSAIDWGGIAQAFTSPQGQFSVPFHVTLEQDTKNTLYATAGILAAGAIITALIIKKA